MALASRTSVGKSVDTYTIARAGTAARVINSAVNTPTALRITLRSFVRRPLTFDLRPSSLDGQRPARPQLPVGWRRVRPASHEPHEGPHGSPMPSQDPSTEESPRPRHAPA